MSCSLWLVLALAVFCKGDEGLPRGHILYAEEDEDAGTDYFPAPVDSYMPSVYEEPPKVGAPVIIFYPKLQNDDEWRPKKVEKFEIIGKPNRFRRSSYGAGGDGAGSQSGSSSQASSSSGSGTGGAPLTFSGGPSSGGSLSSSSSQSSAGSLGTGGFGLGGFGGPSYGGGYGQIDPGFAPGGFGFGNPGFNFGGHPVNPGAGGYFGHGFGPGAYGSGFPVGGGGNGFSSSSSSSSSQSGSGVGVGGFPSGGGGFPVGGGQGYGAGCPTCHDNVLLRSGPVGDGPVVRVGSVDTAGKGKGVYSSSSSSIDSTGKVTYSAKTGHFE